MKIAQPFSAGIRKDAENPSVSRTASRPSPIPALKCWIYWEALTNVGVEGDKVETLITSLPAASDLEATLECEGLERITSSTNIEEFDYESSEQFLNAPLIADFLMPGWLHSLPEATQAQAAQEIARIIDDDRHEAEFLLSVKATLLMGRKGELPIAG